MAKKKKSFMTPKASRRKARKKRTTVTGRKKKEFTYRGYEVEELKAMPLWPSEEDPSYVVYPQKMSTLLTAFAVQQDAQSAHTAETCQSYRSSSERESQFTTDKTSLKSMLSQR